MYTIKVFGQIFQSLS